MKNRNTLLADFYLDLLALPHDEWRARHIDLYSFIVSQLAIDLDSDVNTIRNIFARMAREDAKI